MIVLDTRQFGGACRCGKNHTVTTRSAIIAPGALPALGDTLREYGVTGKRCALYDEKIYAAAAGRRPYADQEIILSSDGLHADEKAVARTLAELRGDVKVLIAVGSGTIHDVARCCARERGLRFASCPTAASVDGFCSTVAAMTWHGYKKTLPAVAPEIVAADTDVIRAAPIELVRSGVGDILAKYTALADWRMAHVLTGEYFCPEIHALMQTAADTAVESVDGLLRGEAAAFENVTKALVLSGIAMQMMGNSRPASGAEHHIAHLIEMHPSQLPVAFSALHGEKTGVGTILTAREYKRLAEIEDIAPLIQRYAPFPAEKMRAFFGEPLFGAVEEENRRDCLAEVTPERLDESWQRLREILAAIPAPEELFRVLERLDARRTPEDIGVSSADLDRLLRYSPLVRNRLTLMRARWLIGA